MPRRRAVPDLSALLDRQYGLIRRDQALGLPRPRAGEGEPGGLSEGGLSEGGLSEGALRWRLAKGHWQTVLPCVYAAQSGPLSRDQQAYAALLYAGESAQLTGPIALYLHRLRHAPDDDRV